LHEKVCFDFLWNVEFDSREAAGQVYKCHSYGHLRIFRVNRLKARPALRCHESCSVQKQSLCTRLPVGRVNMGHR
jgi:hypothetical protein